MRSLPPRSRRSILILTVLLAAVPVWWMQRGGDGDADAEAAMEYSTLADGADDTRVDIALVSDRPRPLPSVCLVLVRDRSGSVTSRIDLDGQIDKELYEAGRALELSGVGGDRVLAVAFADRAVETKPGDDTTQDVLSVLTDSYVGDGTSFAVGLRAAASTTDQCNPGSEIHTVLLTDGLSSEGDVAAGLDALPTAARLHVVAIGVEWSDHQWRERASSVRRISSLREGTVAMDLADLLHDITQQEVEIRIGNESNTST